MAPVQVFLYARFVQLVYTCVTIVVLVTLVICSGIGRPLEDGGDIATQLILLQTRPPLTSSYTPGRSSLKIP
jgi:hypothetical protein